jgi:hypothetical protein
MRLHNNFLIGLVVFSASLTGCGDMVRVTGKVTYPNGQPLTIGQVIFTDDFYMGKSDLDKNGEYSIHSVRPNDGIKRGVYRAYITSAIRFEPTEEITDAVLNYRCDDPDLLIDMQHTNPDTSGWVFDLQKNSKIDFVVYPPGEVPEEERTEAAKTLFDPEYRKKVKEQQGEAEPPKPIKRRTVNPNLL